MTRRDDGSPDRAARRRRSSTAPATRPDDRRLARGRHAHLARALRPRHARLGRALAARGLHGHGGLRARRRGDAPRERPAVGAARLPRRRRRARAATASRSPTRAAACSPSLEVEEAYEYDKEREAEHCFRTTDDAHPGVARLYAQKPLYLAGRVTVFERRDAGVPRARARPRRDARGSSPSAAGSASSASRPATRSTARTST